MVQMTSHVNALEGIENSASQIKAISHFIEGTKKNYPTDEANRPAQCQPNYERVVDTFLEDLLKSTQELTLQQVFM